MSDPLRLCVLRLRDRLRPVLRDEFDGVLLNDGLRLKLVLSDDELEADELIDDTDESESLSLSDSLSDVCESRRMIRRSV